MSRRTSPFTFVNLHGQPLGASDAVKRTQRAMSRERAQAYGAVQLSAAEVERVFDALALAGWQRERRALTALLRALDWRRDQGELFDVVEVGVALQQLTTQGRAQTHEDGGWSAPSAAAEGRLAELLRDPELPRWWRSWLWVANGEHGARDQLPRYFAERGPQELQALLRMVLASGADLALYSELQRGTLAYTETTEPLLQALAQLQRMQLLDRVDAPLLWRLLESLDSIAALGEVPALLDWAETHLAQAPAGLGTSLRLRIAERHLHRCDGAGMTALVEADPQAKVFLPLLQTLLLAQQGRFDASAAAFPPAWKALTALLGKRRGFAPMSLLQWVPLALMAQPDAAAWTQARKFCVAMSGSRKPPPTQPWGLWAHAVAVRLGDERLQDSALRAHAHWDPAEGDCDRLADLVILAAWLNKPPAGWTAALLQGVSDGLHRVGLPWKADLLLQACVRLNLPAPTRPADAAPPWPVSFFAPRQDAWREALSAIVAIGSAESADAAEAAPLLHWTLHLDAEGRVRDLQAFELAASARGKVKMLTPLQLKKRARLHTLDAAVARSLRSSPYRSNDVGFDLVQAAQALLGHPGLSLGDQPGRVLELVESLPVLEVRRERRADAEHFVFHLHDALLAQTEPDLGRHVFDHAQLEAEIERRNSLRIVRDSAERARLIRITPAQRRVAELVSQRWTVPVQASAELDAALRVLAGHFTLHSDASAGEPVAAEARLLAQMRPRGEALELVLAVRPFGDFGPVLSPGQGRVRLLALHRGLNLATERDLDAERGHLATVLARLPFLAEASDEPPTDGRWLLEDPEQALAAVHELGALAAQGNALRALEWPQGQPVRVLAPPAQAFATQLASGRGWLELQGELQLDEGRVLSLQKLLALLREAGGSRYVALGEGQYLRLADQLRQRLAELEALAEVREGQVKLGLTASVWLADAAAELGVKGDAAWRRRAAELERAATLEPAAPPTLQATLRPYQHEGYVWMCRLAQAGFGAILADDMGLGKTVQTLALLLARAAQGPALVLAPTSVCDNWADETARFAPGLRAAVYGRGEVERAGQLQAAAAGDVIVVSYALLLRDAEAFAARHWATLVLDEAQALKNAATQRVQAVATLQADFRLALSGTPVENRLADLWSIMNLLNPGLLGSAARFGERFAGPIERQRNEAARARLRRLVSPFLLRRTKAQVLTDLPPRTEIVQRIEPDAEERAFLEALRRDALLRIAALDNTDPNRRRFNVLAELTRLRRAACDPRLAAPELGRIGAKLRAFEQLATELVESRHQALVFSQFTDFLALLAERLDACGLRYRMLDGSTPAPARAQRVAEFQRGEADLFLISLKAGGFGLNLTAADYVVIADPWWNPAAEDQAMGRAHRIGQQRPVTVYRLVTAGSIEERIVALHHDKRELADGLLADQDGSAPLAADELIDLLRDDA
ncbi:MAG: DEAD/DEAH box helicase [Burkholderiales bacterium]|nr:DEAD/DEAH box helicase [Burkholderiales bacterium]